MAICPPEMKRGQWWLTMGAAMNGVLPVNQTPLLCAESGGGQLSDGDQDDLLVYSR